jgi:hypothetical protein
LPGARRKVNHKVSQRHTNPPLAIPIVKYAERQVLDGKGVIFRKVNKSSGVGRYDEHRNLGQMGFERWTT